MGVPKRRVDWGWRHTTLPARLRDEVRLPNESRLRCAAQKKVDVLDRVSMHVFVRDHDTMIAAPVQCDVDGIPKGSRHVRVPIAIGPPNGWRLSCGALKKDSFHNLRAPPASSACQAARPSISVRAPFGPGN